MIGIQNETWTTRQASAQSSKILCFSNGVLAEGTLKEVWNGVPECSPTIHAHFNHMKSTIRENGPHAFAHLVNVSAVFDNPKILLTIEYKTDFSHGLAASSAFRALDVLHTQGIICFFHTN